MENNDLDLTSLANEESSISNDDNVFSLPNSQFDLPLRITSFPSEKDYDFYEEWIFYLFYVFWD